MMKNILLTILLTITFNINANELFLYNTKGTPEISEVVQNELIILPTIIGNTYSLKNGLAIVSSTNDYYTEYIFPQKLSIAQLANTQAYFNDYNIVYTNNFKLPQNLYVNKSEFTFSFIGEIYCSSIITNQTIVSTPMANIVFNKSSLFIKSDKKLTHVYIIDGSATVLDSKSKKKKEINTGTYLVVTPKPNMDARGMYGIRNNSNIFSIRELDDNDIKEFIQVKDTLIKNLNNVLFVNYDTNIFGIKIK